MRRSAGRESLISALNHSGLIRLAFLAIALLFTCAVRAQNSDLEFARNARTFETVQSSLIEKGMAHACLATVSLPDTIPCNPAQVAYVPKPKVGMVALLSNGYETLDHMRRLLSGDISQDQIDYLFGEGRVLQIEANIELDFQAKNFAARYTPYNIKYFSVVRNEADPQVDLYAINEKSFVAQTGFELTHGLAAGVQVRNITRQYIHQRLSIFALATPSGQAALATQTQNVTYFEPGLSYVIGDQWKWSAAALLANLGMESQPAPGLDMPLEVQGAIGVSPPVSWGQLHFEIDYRTLDADEQPVEKFRYGALYQLGAMSIAAGVDGEGVSAGVYHGFEQVNAGIMYSTTQVPWRSSDYYEQTVYLQVGWEI